MNKSPKSLYLVIGLLLLLTFLGYVIRLVIITAGERESQTLTISFFAENIELLISTSDQGATDDHIFNVILKEGTSKRIVYEPGSATEPQFFFSDDIIYENGYLLVDEVGDDNLHRKWIYLLSQKDNIVHANIKHIGGESASIASYLQYTASNRCTDEYPTYAPRFLSEGQIADLILKGCLDALSITNGEYHLTFDGLSTISYSEMDNGWIWDIFESCEKECDYVGGIVE